jgi:hypothetical protein
MFTCCFCNCVEFSTASALNLRELPESGREKMNFAVYKVDSTISFLSPQNTQTEDKSFFVHSKETLVEILINNLKPSGYYMYDEILRTKTKHSEHKIYLCVFVWFLK